VTVSTVLTRFDRLYFTPTEKLFVIMMLTKRHLVVKLMEEEEDLLLTAAYFQLQIMKKTRMRAKAQRDGRPV